MTPDEINTLIKIQQNITKLRAELDAAKRREVVLSKYAEHAPWCNVAIAPDRKCNCGLAAALQPDAGRDLFTREQVLPLVDGLKFYLPGCEAQRALDHAKTLGFEI
jgi:hypothetical protein